ncbi:MAG TPA: ABC transporter permease [Actinomycetes bacterium]|nr:ABC transporter permease [Actinomycetes bacterium]
MTTGRRQRWWLGAGGLLGFLVLLELVPRAGLVPDRYLPPTSRIAGALAAELGQAAFWAALGDTLQGWAIGLAVAVGAGVALGLLLGSVPALRAATSSTIEFLRPIPSVALIPLAVLLFGTDLRSKLLLVVYASFWQVQIQVLHGVQDVDPVAMDTAHSYGLGRWARIRHVVWPTALPYAVTGFRLAAAVALVLAVTAELIIGSPGLGREIAVAQTSGAVPAMYALVVVAGLLGVGVNLVARALERRVLAWHPSTRREAAA